mmetsp:Transcript_32547/g.91159  ORF Transcript_32547/g.91159 Transcript_32547/m.91159 type:complete len:211 (-) Transcript_32547:392-1024(-)|eukprot:CAMPEP_0119158724 /NCGR_PEP_ID=MMETSP1310-20130426/53404_1 /TAXON_ID=464262 /ORGANISM="Genus nov. species nov., Strain RCC2339" /LENGTH=210 /DNA_ID=CAMNT_0007151349 /DNA_START=57 /DNA_END=689 /DNA_ORIENTATION=+
MDAEGKTTAEGGEKTEEFFNEQAMRVMEEEKRKGGFGRKAHCVWVVVDGKGVTHRLFLGDYTSARDESFLRENGITHIVNSTRDLPLYHEAKGDKYKYFRLVVTDCWPMTDPEAVMRLFTPALDFITDGMTTGNVLCHCLAGVHRSAVTLCMWLYHRERQDKNWAYKIISNRRTGAQPTLYREAMDIFAQAYDKVGPTRDRAAAEDEEGS